MTGNDLTQLILYFGLLTLLAVPLGHWMARVYAGEKTLLSRLVGPLERWLYRLAGVDVSEEAYAKEAASFRAEGREPWPYDKWKSILVWQRYASPVWMDINQTRTLQYRNARDEKDEVHISPLQLDVIERCIDLWSLPGETVLTPFLGIGSEVYCAVEMGRKGVGFELKPSYFAQAVRNIAELHKARTGNLFQPNTGEAA